MSLANVWLQMLDGSLVRGDQVTEITLHQTPEIAGKPSRWLLDVAVAVPVGSGDPSGWRTGPLHRTLAQTDRVREAPHPERTAAAGDVRFGFTSFAGADASDASGPSTPQLLDGSAPNDLRELTSRNTASSGAHGE